jgi:8-oxo-dGTP diphosphatase
MEKPEEIEVAVVILYDGPRMLVCRRPPGSYFEDWWEWPGGKRQPGESLEQCARRELREETGMRAGPLLELQRTAAEYPGRRVQLTFFAGLAAGGAAESPALECRWLLPGEVLELRFLEANLPLLRRLCAGPPRLQSP